MYALDTNTTIYFFKGMGRVQERLAETPPNLLSIPLIVVYELEVGLAKSVAPTRRRAQLEELLLFARILPFSRREAQVAAGIRADLESRGQPIGPLDTLIAATAVSHGATLVTHNVDEFGRVPALDMEDWY